MKILMIYYFLNFISILMMFFIIMISIAFLTLLERKILGYIQNRKGPNKIGFIGLFQPFSEAIKLLSKEMIYILKSNIFFFYLSPMLSLILLILIWFNYNFFYNIFFMNNSILLIILILSMNSYLIMIMSWSSNSLYSIIGMVRSIAQVLSYEVSFMMIILIQMILMESYSLINLMKWQKFMWFLWIMIPIFLIFFISILAELNRSPMDLIEGESELVSGFNIEYFSSSFIMIFLTEYGMIMFMSYFMMNLFILSNFICLSFFIFNILILLIIYMRGILPRMRYDELMNLGWKIILPMILNYLMFFLLFKEIFCLII